MRKTHGRHGDNSQRVDGGGLVTPTVQDLVKLNYQEFENRCSNYS